MIEIQSWSTGEYRSWKFDSRREAFIALRQFKASYFDQVFYIGRAYPAKRRRTHKYVLPAFCTFPEFLDNIGEHVKITRIL